MTYKLKKNACNNAYIGSIFIPGKYVFRVRFESPFTRIISSLKYKWPPPGAIGILEEVGNFEDVVMKCFVFVGGWGAD